MAGNMTERAGEGAQVGFKQEHCGDTVWELTIMQPRIQESQKNHPVPVSLGVS